MSRVASLRNLEPTEEVRVRVIDRATMVDQIRRRVHADVPPAALRGEGEFLKAFGLLPGSFDYEDGVFRLIQSELAGYYDPEEKRMFVMDDLPAEAFEATLFHELVHALQDQRHPLGSHLKYERNASDRQAAIQSLAEGDATSAMIDWTLEREGRTALDLTDAVLHSQLLANSAASTELSRFPRVLRASLVAPYVDGLALVQQLRRRGGWAAVDSVWLNPPVTSEQVLHLDKLDSHEPAEAVPVPSIQALGLGWRVIHSDVYGEQAFRVALEEWMSAGAAAEAAAGWAGDHTVVAVRDSDSESAAAWHLRFDPSPAPSEPGAEAAAARDAVLSAWFPDRSNGSACKMLPSGRSMALSRKGRDFAIVACPPPRSSANPPGLQGCSLAQRWADIVAADHGMLTLPPHDK